MHVHLEITTQNSACIIFKNTSKAAFNDAFKNPKIQFTFHKKILSMSCIVPLVSSFSIMKENLSFTLLGEEKIYMSPCMLFRFAEI